MRKLEVSHSSATHSCRSLREAILQFFSYENLILCTCFSFTVLSSTPAGVERVDDDRLITVAYKELCTQRKSYDCGVHILLTPLCAFVNSAPSDSGNWWRPVGSRGIRPFRWCGAVEILSLLNGCDLCRDLGQDVRYHEALPIPSVEGGGRSGQRSGFKNDSRP